MRPLHDHLCGTDFSGVDIAGHQQNGFAFARQGLDLLRRKTARVGEFVCDFLVMSLVLQVLGPGDLGHNEVIAERGRPKGLDLDTGESSASFFK